MAGGGDLAVDPDAALAASLTPERLVVVPFYHELRNAVFRPERVKLQTGYSWRQWVPQLGPVRTLIALRLRQLGYFSRQTGEVRDEVAPTYQEIARSIGISTRSIARYLESEPDPASGAAWVTATIVEAVDAGSRYVAPRRIRQICLRWAAEGRPTAAGAKPDDGARGRGYGLVPRRMPRAARQFRGQAGSSPPAEGGGSSSAEPLALDVGKPAVRLAVPTFRADPAPRLTNRQLWAAVLEELRRSVLAGPSSIWLKPTRLIGLVDPPPDALPDNRPGLAVGVPTSLAREWVAERHGPQGKVVGAVGLGQRRRVCCEVERKWQTGGDRSTR